MYRETMVAAALANALEELKPSLQLTDDQMQVVWNMFDQSMTEALREAHPATSITIDTAPPLRPNVSPCTDNTTAGTAADVASLASESIQFPLYRVHDDLWTIVLKDTAVTIQEEGGKKEVVQLDYLKCYLKDATAANGPRAKRRRKE